MGNRQGRIVILNGPPRAGKTTIARSVQAGVAGHWMTMGVDLQSLHVIPQALRPGIGLRPGGERPDLEPYVERLYRALYKSIKAHAEEGFDVVADLGHHEDYATLGPILPQCAQLIAGFRVLYVRVRASLDTILERRASSNGDRTGPYLTSDRADVPAPILRWQNAVDVHGDYDLTIDTDVLDPDAAAREIARALEHHATAPTAFERLAQR